MGLISILKKLFDSKSSNSKKELNKLSFDFEGKKHNLETLLMAIGSSKNKTEVITGSALCLAIASLNLKNENEDNAKTIIVGLMNIVNSRNDELFTLGDLWPMIVKSGLRDFANKVLGTSL